MATRKAAAPAAPTTLSDQDLARATLARQYLTARVKQKPLAALDRLLAIQAQWPKPPFFAFLARLAGFRREDLMADVRTHAIVRGTAYRGTIFLQRAEDFARFRSAVVPTLERAVTSMVAKKVAPSEHARVVARGKALFAEQPRTFDAIRDVLGAEENVADAVRAMALLLRMRLPLVQVASDLPWGWHAACDFALAERVLEKRLRPALAAPSDLEELVRRYLAALGPGSVADAQTFTGVTGLKAVFEKLRPELVTFRDERKKELFDLPKSPRPAEGEVPLPVRFLPDFDNVAIGHADRRRFVADEHRPFVYLAGLVVGRTFLVDGRAAGTWELVTEKKSTVLEITPFGALSKKVKAEVEEEGNALLEFAAPDVAARTMRFKAR